MTKGVGIMTGSRLTGLVSLFALLVLGIPSFAQEGSKGTSGGKYQSAIFAGGCFWCMEPAFEKLHGVISVTSGYTGGRKKNPTYEEVSSGSTGHAESVQVLYDPRKISYEKLLEVFWHNIDPTTPDRQFCDRGSQYRSGIFYLNDEQKRLALESKAALEKSKPFKEPVVTEITPAAEFYPAEEYHQDFYKKNPVRYNTYRTGCGRDRRLKELWGKLSDALH